VFALQGACFFGAHSGVVEGFVEVEAFGSGDVCKEVADLVWCGWYDRSGGGGFFGEGFYFKWQWFADVICDVVFYEAG